MRLRSLLIILAAWLCLAPGLRRDRSERPDSHSVPRSVGAGLVSTWVCPDEPSPSGCFSRLAPWRHRIKSVLEKKDVRGLQPIAQGPALIPDHLHLPAQVTFGAGRSTPLISRRC